MNYQIRPEDVVVLDRNGRSTQPPPPRQKGAGAWLAKRRFTLAAALAGLETAGVLVGKFPTSYLLLLAIAAVAIYWFGGRRLRPDALRTFVWIVAAAQVLLALLGAFVITGLIAATIVLVAVGLISVMVFLGNRERS